MRRDHGSRKFLIFSLLDRREGNLSWKKKHQNETNWSLKKYKKLFISKILSLVRAVCTSILSTNWKNNTTFTVSTIQTMKKLNNPTTTSFAGLFLIVVRFNLLEWWHSHKNKETFYPFFFLWEIFIFATVMIVHKFGDLNFSIHPI